MTQHPKATVKVAFFVLFLLLSFLSGESSKTLSFRALWIVRTSMISQKEIDAALIFAERNNFNHIFVQVRGRDDSFYSSQVVPKADLIVEKNFDPLDYTIRRGHEIGLKVHAWMNVYLVWSSNRLPENSEHVLNLHPDWMDRSSFGNGNQRFLSPAHPAVMEYLLDVMKEVLLNYKIDGLHLDYIRYRNAESGYNGAARRGFEREHGIDPLRLYFSSITGSPTWRKDETKFLWQQWNQYRRNAITDFVRRCNTLILDTNSNCLLSVAVKPNPNSAKEWYYQEWDRWLVEGLVDYVVPMNYSQDLREFARNIDRVYESIPMKYWPGIVMGIAVYNQNALDARDKIKYSKFTGFSGISIFSYDAHKDNQEFFVPIVEEISR